MVRSFITLHTIKQFREKSNYQSNIYCIMAHFYSFHLYNSLCKVLYINSNWLCDFVLTGYLTMSDSAMKQTSRMDCAKLKQKNHTVTFRLAAWFREIGYKFVVFCMILMFHFIFSACKLNSKTTPTSTTKDKLTNFPECENQWKCFHETFIKNTFILSFFSEKTNYK